MLLRRTRFLEEQREELVAEIDKTGIEAKNMKVMKWDSSNGKIIDDEGNVIIYVNNENAKLRSNIRKEKGKRKKSWGTSHDHGKNSRHLKWRIRTNMVFIYCGCVFVLFYLWLWWWRKSNTLQWVDLEGMGR